MNLLLVSQALGWLVLGALAVLVLALARQVGVLHERLAPLGPLAVDNGLAVGEAVPRLETTDAAGEPVAVGGPGARLLLFTAPHCTACARLAPAAAALCAARQLPLVMLGEGPAARLLGAGRTPYAALIDPAGRLLAKDTITEAGQLATMLDRLTLPERALHAA